MASDELMQVPGKWDIEYSYTAGVTASRFLTEVRDNKRIMGKRCDSCNRVYVPPRTFCETCFVETSDWVEVGNVGEIESYTFGPRKFSTGLPEPFIIAYVILDGADTSIANFVMEMDMTDMKVLEKELFVGKKVEVKYKNEREGRISDFCFVPIER